MRKVASNQPRTRKIHMKRKIEPTVICAQPLRRSLLVPPLAGMKLSRFRGEFKDNVLHSAELDVYCEVPDRLPKTRATRVQFWKLTNLWSADKVAEMKEKKERVLGVQPTSKALEQRVLNSRRYFTSLGQIRSVMRSCEQYRCRLIRSTKNPSHSYGTTPHFCFLRTGRRIRIVWMPPMSGTWSMIVESLRGQKTRWGPTAIAFAPV
ncbi:MAG: hypothetical protein A2664_01545 [Candidatus Taylorbacteria bacterium RIFCSPHIGHO2_01_FULL_46_22b]|uniref:Uncharacterized protein n=1 Tax=Candidatus Taylorbacteria bacterium RIFCSPHIGHO2_01_FULL_46_22b TaxID=1802301 RepID=A0A1G2M2K9_9BACT|nr:MAG: hypothetical protein A2664_01545 [Candidatus Taylorbacteria bacterium RIFCSPHIGHO2_01_FULL_46_22b]